MGSRGPRRRLSTWQVVTLGAKVARSRVRNPVVVLTTAFAPSLHPSDPRFRAAPRYSGRSGSGRGRCGRGGTITGSTSPRSSQTPAPATRDGSAAWVGQITRYSGLVSASRDRHLLVGSARPDRADLSVGDGFGSGSGGRAAPFPSRRPRVSRRYRVRCRVPWQPRRDGADRLGQTRPGAIRDPHA